MLFLVTNIMALIAIFLFPLVYLGMTIYRLAGVRVQVRYLPWTTRRTFSVMIFAIMVVLSIWNWPNITDFTQSIPHIDTSVVASASKLPTLVSAWMPTTEQKIRRIALNHGVSPELALAIAQWETGMSHTDRSGRIKISSSGAIGMFQLKPETASDMGVDPYDEEGNIKGGVRYLRFLKGLFEEEYRKRRFTVPSSLKGVFEKDPVTVLTIAAYHAGVGRIVRSSGIPEHPGGEWDDALWHETVKYVTGVISLMKRF